METIRRCSLSTRSTSRTVRTALATHRRSAALLDRYTALADEARACNQERLRFMPDEYIHDLEARIAMLRVEL